MIRGSVLDFLNIVVCKDGLWIVRYHIDNVITISYCMVTIKRFQDYGSSQNLDPQGAQNEWHYSILQVEQRTREGTFFQKEPR